MQKQLKLEKQNISQPLKIIFQKQQTQKRQIKKVYACSNRSYCIFEDIVITWGQIIFGKDNQSQNQNKQKSKIKSKIIPIKINELALGSNHTFAYTKSIQNSLQQNSYISSSERDDYSVYCWGSNQNYELGLEDEKYYDLVKVDLFDQAFEAGLILNQMSCGDSHTLAVFKDQQSGQTKLFGWGESKSYQLALDTTGIIPYPVDIQCYFNSPIYQIQSKSDYNIAILQNGEIYSWGSNMFNRLGLNQCKIEKNFLNTSRQVKKSINQVSEESSITQRNLNNVDHGNIKIQKVKIPKKIQIFNKKIIKISLGTYHAIAISNQGECFSWGNGIYGQLGNNRFGQCAPQKITTKHLLFQTFFISCCAGEQHSCILDKDGNVYTCGSNSFGVLGHKKHENQTRKKRCKIFQKVQYFQQRNIKINSISSGNRHILTEATSSQIYGWGSNQNGQIIFQETFIFQTQNKNINSGFEKNQIQENQLRKKNQQIFNHKQNQIEVPNKKNQKHFKQDDNISQSYQVHVNFIGKSNQSTQKVTQNKLQLQRQTQKQDQTKYNLKTKQKENKIIQQIYEWKSRYHKFVVQKRTQQDKLMTQLDDLVGRLQKNKGLNADQAKIKQK